MTNPFAPKPQKPFDPHRFVRLRDFLEDNNVDWESYLQNLLIGFAPVPCMFGRNLYLDRSDVSTFRGRLRAESLRRTAELIGETEILAPPIVETIHALAEDAADILHAAMEDAVGAA